MAPRRPFTDDIRAHISLKYTDLCVAGILWYPVMPPTGLCGSQDDSVCHRQVEENHTCLKQSALQQWYLSTPPTKMLVIPINGGFKDCSPCTVVRSQEIPSTPHWCTLFQQYNHLPEVATSTKFLPAMRSVLPICECHLLHLSTFTANTWSVLLPCWWPYCSEFHLLMTISSFKLTWLVPRC